MREADSPTVATYNNLQRTSPPPLAITAAALSLSSPHVLSPFPTISFSLILLHLSLSSPTLYSHSLLSFLHSPAQLLLSHHHASSTFSLSITSCYNSLSSVLVSLNRLLSAQLDSASISSGLIFGEEEEVRIMAMKGFLEPLVADMICDDPFDSIDDLLDFPNDDDGGLAMVESWGDGAALTPAPAHAMIPAGCGGGATVGSATRGADGRSTAVSGDVISSENDTLCLYDEIDTANLEWLSNFFADSEINFDFIPAASPDPKPRSSSPVSVLHPGTLAAGAVTSSSSSCSSSSSSSSTSRPTMSPPPHPAAVPARARTKRPRLPSLSARTFVPPSSSAPNSFPAAGKKMKKDAEAAPPSVRRCSHCDVQKTPQWRAGPMGPKTLCNACGVRYKSGRLFPEYRPAVSPTFVPAVHSNSHRKVVEMRLRCTEMTGKSGRGQIREGTVAAKNCDLVEYIRRQD